MKTTILTYLVGIALASTNVIANVIPVPTRDFRRLAIEVSGPLGSSPAIRRHLESRQDVNASIFEIPIGTAESLAGTVVIRGVQQKNNNNNDQADIHYLNLALVLEQLLVAFFERGLGRYSQEDFRRAAYPEWVRGRYLQIFEHEKAHKEFLQSAITAAGSGYVRPCRYEFTDNDVRAFIDISAALETISTSAYVGALQFFNNKAYITTGATILAVEARHASWINGAVRKINPWNTAFETPLTANEVATLLSNFLSFDSCPRENAGLLPPGFHPYPKLSLAPRLVPGELAEISFPYPNNLQGGERLYVAFLVGIETIFAPVEERRIGEGQKGEGNNNKRYFVQLPRDLAAKGTVYFILIRGGDNIRDVRLDEQSIVAGPAIAEFPFDSNYQPIKW